MSSIGKRIIQALGEFTEGLKAGKRPTERTVRVQACKRCGQPCYAPEGSEPPGCPHCHWERE